MLAGFGFVIIALAALPFARSLSGRAVFLGAAAVLGLAAGLAVLALLSGARAVLELPFGPPWARMSLALDPLSAWFALLVSLSGLAASLAAAAAPEGPPRAAIAWPLFLGAMLLALLAGDLFTLLLGFEAMSLASWVLVCLHHRGGANRRAARLYLGFAAFSGLCLIAAAALFATPSLAFAALRAAPPEGLRAAAILALVLLGTGAKAGLAPLHGWLPLAHPAAPAYASAVMSGAMVKVALYVMLRCLFDLAGPAQPGWWGAPLIVLGACSALLGALRANLETDTKALLAGSTVENVGLIALACGLALLFRGADLGALAALALTAALLHALGHALFKTLLFLCAGQVLRAAGAREMDRLGGLARGMPLVAVCAAIGAASAAALPPLAGFAGEWLLLQSLVAAWRVADLLPQVLTAASLALAGIAVALGAAAMLRFCGLVFLGRPRTPRAAGAGDAHGLALLALVLPAALAACVGLFAAPLAQLAEGALRVALGPAAHAPVAGLALVAPEGGARYAPPLILLAMLLLGAAIAWGVRRLSPWPAARGPAWDCGFAAPPAHLPFGDPLTQPSAAGLGQPLRRMLGTAVLSAREPILSGAVPRLAASWRDPAFPALLQPLHAARHAATLAVERLRDLTIHQCLALSFGSLVALLALVAWLERA
jgi:formate hydrogenlyase subunit 3/multisubunit Na+/H+ antiporter MnhD subunit